MDKKAFGKRLQKYREKSGYSQELLAEKIGCSTIFISYMERGEKSPSLNTLIKLSNILNIPADILLGNESSHYNSEILKNISKSLNILPPKEQKRILDVFESIMLIELSYYKEMRN